MDSSLCRLITNVLLLLIQTDEQEPGDFKDGGRDPLAGCIEEDQSTAGKEKSRVGDPLPEQDTEAGDKPQPASTPAEDHADKPTSDADLKEEKDEGDKKEEKLAAVKKCNHAEGKMEKDGLKTEGQEKEEKEKNLKAAKEEQKQGDLEKAKDKPQLTGAETKQGKTKKKSGPPSSVSRPRMSARAIRSSAKKDIIAKFQQGAPE